ncbi:MAG: VOC family protein, partial [Thermostichales cyanobacterium SRBZ-1_bins_19]
SIKTRDIFRSPAFYEILGFRVEERFTAGITLACWLQGCQLRLELMQVPTPAPTPDPWDPDYVGYYHLSFAVADVAATLAQLRQVIPDLQVLLEPELQTIGPQTYQVAFIRDPDGLPIELLAVVGRENW